MIQDISDEDFAEFEGFRGSPSEYVDEWNRLGWGKPAQVTDIKDRFDRDIKKVEFVTHGWSGNEHLVSIIERTLFHFAWWESSHRGGLTVWHIPFDAWYNTSGDWQDMCSARWRDGGISK